MSEIDNPYALVRTVATIGTDLMVIEIDLTGIHTPDGPAYDAITIRTRHSETGASLSYTEIPVSSHADVARALFAAGTTATDTGELVT